MMMAKNKSRRPMLLNEVRRIKPIPPKGSIPSSLRTQLFSTVLTFERGMNPGLNTRFERIRDVRGGTQWRVEVDTKGIPIPSQLPLLHAERRPVNRKTLEGIRGPIELAPHRPDFIGMTPLPKKAKLPRRAIVQRRDGREIEPYFIFDPDGRQSYHDHHYPWCCFGQVKCANGATGSGVLIGPRHVLTASHVLDWNAPWPVFRANLNGSHDHGVANTWCVWYYAKIAPNSTDIDLVDEDYVVCVLDKPLGNTYGYMGAKTYNDDWDGDSFWTSLGYEEDFGSATIPTYQAGFSMEEIDGGKMKAMSTRDGDFAHGHSGGPVFAFWDGGPYVGGVVVGGAQDDDGAMNVVSGGVAMVRLILQARAETP